MTEPARELMLAGEVGGPQARVAIVGVSFGGLFVAKALRRADVDVTVIDRTNHHVFVPLLYQMATGILAEGDIAHRSATCCDASATRA